MQSQISECICPYEGLNLSANQLAHRLSRMGAGPEKRILLLMNRGVKTVAAMIGILKSGSTCIPISPPIPDQIINQIIKEVSPDIIVTQNQFLARLKTSNAAIMDMDHWELYSNREIASNPNVPRGNTAFIIYLTDASSPLQGVMIPHSALIAYFNSTIEIFNIQSDE